MSQRLIILDRDGVINRESSEFVKSPDEWQPIEGSIDAIARLSGAGFKIAVATNQSGIGRKIIDKPALDDMHDKMRSLVRDAGGDIDRVVYCPHLPDEDCDCRKPKPGMYRQLSRLYGMPLDGVPMVGDSERDVLAARAVGGRAILVLTGNGHSTRDALQRAGTPVETFDDLAAVATALIAAMAER